MIKAPDMKLHHLGVLVENIAASSRSYHENFGYEIRSEIIHDPLQAAFVRFLAMPAETLYLELISPDGPQSFLQNALKRAPGANHICFSTLDLEESLRHLSSAGGMVLRPPVPAVAFRNKRIAWIMDPDCALIELVERGTHGELDFLPPAVR
jgi:catechol 2,3-dioxygenase-like lactoylglutathione lyase family enzyme